MRSHEIRRAWRNARAPQRLERCGKHARAGRRRSASMAVDDQAARGRCWRQRAPRNDESNCFLGEAARWLVSESRFAIRHALEEPCMIARPFAVTGVANIYERVAVVGFPTPRNCFSKKCQDHAASSSVNVITRVRAFAWPMPSIR
jgi:hypothetical protein